MRRRFFVSVYVWALRVVASWDRRVGEPSRARFNVKSLKMRSKELSNHAIAHTHPVGP